MRYYRCKCGEAEAWGSMPPYRCSHCSKCGSDLAEDPSLHIDPAPHDFSAVQTIHTDQGDATITRCLYCHRTRDEIARAHKENP